MKKLLVGLFVFALLAMGSSYAHATSPVIMPNSGTELVCCESFGYGANMVKTTSTYEMTAKNKCSTCILDMTTGLSNCLSGGGKNIVDANFCKPAVICPMLSTPSTDYCLNGTIKIITGNDGCQSYQCIDMNTNTPVISGVSGPQTLNVDQIGTWTIKASGPMGGNLSYSVNWGDSIYCPSSGGPCSAIASALAPQQSATFTHTYSTTGTYKPTFTVTGENTIRCITTPCPTNGGSASTSLSVKVRDVEIKICPAGCTCNGEVTTCKVPVEPIKGCLSGYKYNPNTGEKCTETTDEDGCLQGYKYNTKTGKLCNAVIVDAPTLPQEVVSAEEKTPTQVARITRTLKKGISGEDVKILQAFLNLAVDGKFGPATQQKVMEWQKENGLNVDGAFGVKSTEKAGLNN